MKIHDTILEGYEVSNAGEVITLYVRPQYTDSGYQLSKISFTGVLLHSFDHTGKAILNNCVGFEPGEIGAEHAAKLESLARSQGVPHWAGDLTTFCEKLKQLNYRFWDLDSAIGFSGFIIAKHTVASHSKKKPNEMPPNNTMESDA